MYDLIVIGGGPAGITLSKMLGKSMKMAVIRPEDHSMIYCAMPYAIEGMLTPEKTLKKDSLVIEAGATLIRGTVKELNIQGKCLTLGDGRKIEFGKLVIATGARPFVPDIPGRELSGVRTFKTEEDMKTLAGLIDRGAKHAVVVGAGAIGVELAQSLRVRGLNVDIVDMAGHILPNMLDREMVEKPQEELIREGIDLHFGAKVTELAGQGLVEEIHLDNGDRINFGNYDNCSMEEEFRGIVIFAAGMRPNVELTHGTGIELGTDGIIVNRRMETSQKDVFAVGDCVQFESGITGKPISGKLATNAVPMAKVLGFNLMGQNREYPGFYNGAATKVGKFFAGGTGLNEAMANRQGIETVAGYSTLTSKFPIMPGAKEIHVKLVAQRDAGRIIGGQVVSEEPVTDRIDLITLAIQLGATAGDMARLSYSAQPWQSFYPAASLNVLAAEEILSKLAE